jgi:hypothetical protein
LVTNLVRVFDQNSSGAIDAPDPKSGFQESAVRIKVVQLRHRMQTIDRNSILAIKAVIGSITDSSFVEQLLPFRGKIIRRFLDLVGSSHADGVFVIHRELQCLIQPEISSESGRTLVPGRHNEAPNAFENAQVRISIKIVRQPADRKCVKVSVLESPSSEFRCQAGLFAAGEHAYYRDERVRKLRVIPLVLVSEGNHKIAVLRIYAPSQAGGNLGLDAVDDLLE